MKSLFLILSLFFAARALSQADPHDKRKSLFSHARNGLSLRSTASLNGTKDTLISYGDELKLIQLLEKDYYSVFESYYEKKYNIDRNSKFLKRLFSLFKF